MKELSIARQDIVVKHGDNESKITTPHLATVIC